MRTALFLVNGLGDQLIAWPVLRALRKILPGELELWLGPGLLKSLYRDIDMERRAIGLAAPGVVDANAAKPDHPKADLFISLSAGCHPSIRELAQRLGARRTIGYSAGYGERTCFSQGEINKFDELFSLARHLDRSVRLEDFAEPPVLSNAAEEAAQFFCKIHLQPGEKLIFVHPETLPAKMWSPEGFARALAGFLEARPEYKVLISSKRDYPVALDRHAGRVFYSDAPLEMSLALLRRASLFLGIDSCFLHGADIFRVPGVGLFGPTRPQEWGFRLSRYSRALSTGGAPLTTIDPHLVLDLLLEVDAESQLRRAV